MFKLRLKNYRGFVNSEFTFSRINILIGENSGGKSSILKFLLALRQSLRAPYFREFNLTLKGPDVDLGTFGDVIHNHETDRTLGFEFEFGKDLEDFVLDFLAPISALSLKETTKKAVSEHHQSVKDSLTGVGSSPTIIKFEVTNDLGNHSTISTSIHNRNFGELSIIHNKSEENQILQDIYVPGAAPKCDIHFRPTNSKKKIVLKDLRFEKYGFLSLIEGNGLRERIDEQVEPESANSVFTQVAFLLVSQNYLQLSLARVEYANPLLSEPAERIYLEGDRKNIRTVKNVRELVEFIETNRHRTDFVKSLAKTLKRYGIADEFYVKKDGVTKQLRISLNGVDSNIKDVGFGVSLQLPIFAQALLSEQSRQRSVTLPIGLGQTLLIEQPEVHLHPKLQAKFIDVLAGLGPNNVYFIETHSEHIVRMLQIIVRDKRYGISGDDVSIHYFQKKGKKFVVSRHSILDESGKLDQNLPKGFYDVSYSLAFSLMK